MTTTVTLIISALLVAVAVHQCVRARTLRTSLAQAQDAAVRFATRLEEVEAGALRDRARLHEITSIVAGVAAATEVARTACPAERAALGAAIEAELLRLRRVLAGDPVDEAGPLDVDGVIDRVVTTHRARGRQISWRPSGVAVVAAPDALAEVVSELLENAARHGAPEGIEVEVATRGDEVEISVEDAGPGVGPGLRDEIFAWGRKRPGSPGQGMGLPLAQRRIRAGGGELCLVAPLRGGARFVITLPVHAIADDAPCDLSHAG